MESRTETKGTLREGAWTGLPAILVGGGPSLRAFDFKLLQGVPRVVVVNRAFLDVPTAEVFITEDARFIERFAHQLLEFKGVKVFSSPDDAYVPRVRECDSGIVVLRARDKRHGWSKKIEDGLSMSSNSAIPALNLIDILGANPIYLLGMDCRMSDDGKAQYHSDYPAEWAIAKAQLESFRSDFEHWAAHHLKLSGRQVLNVVDPDFESAIQCWDKISFAQFDGLIR